MSRKDYNAVAALINNLNTNIPYGTKDQYYDDGYADAIKDLTDGLADIFAQENERFEYTRFIRACGV